MNKCDEQQHLQHPLLDYHNVVEKSDSDHSLSLLSPGFQSITFLDYVVVPCFRPYPCMEWCHTVDVIRGYVKYEY